MKEISHQVEVHLTEYLLFCRPTRTAPNVRNPTTARCLYPSVFIVFVGTDPNVAHRRESKGERESEGEREQSL